MPTTAVGLWAGTELLVFGDATWLKSLLGVVVVLSGAWFIIDERRRHHETDELDRDRDSRTIPKANRPRVAWSVMVGFLAGALGGLFGTGGPPVVLLLKGYRLDKGAFRATLILYFLLMSVLRGGHYLTRGILTLHEFTAALWLLPASVLGTLLGMLVHRRISERHFASSISMLLVLLGLLLLIRGGR